MTGFWLISYVVLWLVVLGLGLVILVMAREIEQMHARLEATQKLAAKSAVNGEHTVASKVKSELQPSV